MARNTDEQGYIVAGLRADIMRKMMENKNLLAEKGSIYVGTGEEGVTAALVPTAIDNGKFLSYTTDKGLHYRDLELKDVNNLLSTFPEESIDGRTIKMNSLDGKKIEVNSITENEIQSNTITTSVVKNIDFNKINSGEAVYEAGVGLMLDEIYQKKSQITIALDKDKLKLSRHGIYTVNLGVFINLVTAQSAETPMTVSTNNKEFHIVALGSENLPKMPEICYNNCGDVSLYMNTLEDGANPKKIISKSAFKLEYSKNPRGRIELSDISFIMDLYGTEAVTVDGNTTYSIVTLDKFLANLARTTEFDATKSFIAVKMYIKKISNFA